MRTNYVTTFPATTEPELPKTTPIPICIVPCDAATDAGPSVPAAQPTTNTAKNDDFYPAWLRFTSVEPRRAKVTSRSARMVQNQKSQLQQSAQSTFRASNHVHSAWDNAVNECRAKVAAIVEECRRLNKKYRDAVFDLEGGCCLSNLDGSYPAAIASAGAPPWVKRVGDIFKDPVFIKEDAPLVDVHQRYLGDCWFLASLISVSAKKDLFQNLCVARDEKVGVYGFVFYRDGEWIYEVIDDKLYMKVGDDDDLYLVRDWDRHKKQGVNIPMRDKKDEFRTQLQTGGEALYFSFCQSNETWLPLIEKAYAKAHGDYYAIEGGFSGEGIEDLTGGVSVVISPEDIMDKDLFWNELKKVNQEYLFGGGSKSRTSKNIQENHAYAILEAWEGDNGLRLLKLRNPWGETEWDGDWSDGSKLWTTELLAKTKHTFGDDGIFWMSYDDFLKHFPAIHRTRMFDNSWYTSQIWTSVNVPWTVDYLDTKFEVSIKERGPVVFVLSQPDDRYFQGLSGRYLFSLHFRVYSNDDTAMSGHNENARYIVRSMYNSGNESIFTRSVSAEIDDLEPGKYSVIFKITARRWESRTAEETIRKYAAEKKEKLLQVGRRFDYAQTKGNLRGLERANMLTRRKEKHEEEVEKLKKGRKRAKKQREQSKKKKQRIEDAKSEKPEEPGKTEEPKASETVAPEKEGESVEEVEAPQQNPSETTLPDRTKVTSTEETVKSDLDNSSDIVVVSADPEKNGASEGDTSEAKTSDVDASSSEKPVESACACSKPEVAKEEKTEEFEDDDFEWSSDLDAPIYDSDSDFSEQEDDDPFADWNAMCVVGLRVYSRNVPAVVEVVEDSS